jgi:AraC-like DNA-binding protein
MTLTTKLDSRKRYALWKALAAQARFEPNRLALLSDISVRQLERYFARDLRVSPKTWLREQRMLAACSLLSTANSVKDIAYSLHFKHVSHFCSEFKKHYGITPTQYVLTHVEPGER